MALLSSRSKTRDQARASTTPPGKCSLPPGSAGAGIEQGRGLAPSRIAVELALLDDPFVRLVGALDAILTVVPLRRQQLRDFVDGARLATAVRARGVKHALSNLELVIAQITLHVGNRRAVRRPGGAEHLSWLDS